MSKPPLKLQTTTLWEYPSQTYGEGMQGTKAYEGATPAYIIWNLLQRYTRRKDLCVDPMCGSGTFLDVARDLGRRGLGYDIKPERQDIFRADAREIPLEDEKADFVFVDPPYSDHIRYEDNPKNIGGLSAREPAYFEEMSKVFQELHRILRKGRYCALYVCDSYQKGKPLVPIAFRFFAELEKLFVPAEIAAVVRHNRRLLRNHWHTAAIEGNYFLRGFNYLIIMYKPDPKSWNDRAGYKMLDRRDAAEVAEQLAQRAVTKGRSPDKDAPRPGGAPTRRGERP